MKRTDPKNLDVVILCGGLGKRLAPVLKNRPKPMAEIDGRPFLDILIEFAASFGFARFILCTGYKGEVIKRYYKNKKNSPVRLFFSEEPQARGTAGAVKNAESMIKSSPFLVMNGDSLCKLNLREFINFHKDKRASFSMVLAKSKGSDDCGRVSVDCSLRIVSFEEKVAAKQNDFINAGIYLLENSIFSMIPPRRRSSLEHDIFPGIASERFYGYITEEELIDIGTPQRYEKAKAILEGNRL